MKIFTTKEKLADEISNLKHRDKKIGFVPTMGALHQGHLSLIQNAREQADITVASIFVNPTQFNNPDDLKNYPQPFEDDIRKLEDSGCDILFHPTAEEMYGDKEHWDYEVGHLDRILEGEFRPGHFKGVTQVVYKLFDLVKPDIAFFGQKDFQQFAVISKMVKDFELPVSLVSCPIIREQDGLAMSSRNVRLNEDERRAAASIYQALIFIKENYRSSLSLDELREKGLSFLKHPLLRTEYLKICEPLTLEELTEKEAEAIVLIACFSGKTRLIDNMMLP